MKAISNVNSSPAGFSHGLVAALKSERLTGLARAAQFGFRPSDWPLRLGVRISAFGIRISALALIAGCTVGPNYKRPEATTIPAAYIGATNVFVTDAGATNG